MVYSLVVKIMCQTKIRPSLAEGLFSGVLESRGLGIWLRSESESSLFKFVTRLSTWSDLDNSY